MGFGDDGARDGDQLLLSARELVGIEVLLADDLEAVQHVADDAVALALLDVAIGQRNVEVLVDGERIEQVIALENEAEVFLVQLHAIFFVELVDGVLDQVILTGPGAVVHAEQVEQRGFARAGRSHDGDELAFLDFRVDAAQYKSLGRPVLEIFLDVPKRQDR